MPPSPGHQTCRLRRASSQARALYLTDEYMQLAVAASYREVYKCGLHLDDRVLIPACYEVARRCGTPPRRLYACSAGLMRSGEKDLEWEVEVLQPRKWRYIGESERDETRVAKEMRRYARGWAWKRLRMREDDEGWNVKREAVKVSGERWGLRRNGGGFWRAVGLFWSALDELCLTICSAWCLILETRTFFSSPLNCWFGNNLLTVSGSRRVYSHVFGVFAR